MRVLIVDDEPGICQRLQRELQKEGCEVDYTTSPVGVLERLRNAEQEEKAYALLLLDLRMPKVDGLALLKEIREARLDLDVVIITGYGDEDKAIESIRLGAVDYLRKPISLEALHTAVFRVQQKRAAEEKRALEYSVLVVDDEKELCARIKRELDKEGYRTAVAYDGTEGLDYFSHNRVDVAIVDIRMPRMGGLEMLEKCREITDDFVSIIITGHGDHERAIRALQLGVFNYLRKPLSLEELVTSVGKGIELLHLRRGLAARRRELELETALKEQYAQNLEKMVEEWTKELGESEARYRLLVENANDAIYTLDADLRITDVNPFAEQAIGYSRDELIGRSFPELGIVAPASLGPAAEDTARVLAGERISGAVYEFITKDGQHLFGELSGAPIYREGQVVGVLAIARDVTERKRAEEEIKRRGEELEALREVSLAITAQLGLDELLLNVVEQGCRLLDVRAGGVYLVDETRGNLQLVVSHGYASDYTGTRMAPGEGLAGRVLRSGEPLVVDDYSRWEGRSPDWEGEPLTAVLGVPLKRGDRVIGVLDFAEIIQARSFDEHDLWLATLFASQAAIAIENAWLYQAERAARESAHTLREVSRVVGSTLELDDVLSLVLCQAKRVLAYDTASILLFAEGQPSMVAVAGYEDEELVKADVPLRLGDSPILQAMVHDHRPVVIADVREDERWIWVPGAEDIRAWIGVPLLVRDEMIGALMIDSTQPGFYTEADAAIVQALANQAAVAIENAHLFEETRGHVARLKEKTRDMELIHQVSRMVSSSLDLTRILETTVEQMVAVFEADHSGILLFDQAKTCGQVVAEYPATGATAERYPVQGYLAAERIIADREPLVIEDVWNDPLLAAVREAMHRLDIRSMLIVPLVVKGEVMGSIGLDAVGRQRLFNAEEVSLAQTIANQVAIAIENARLYQQAQQEIAERKRAEEEVHRRAAHLEALNAIIAAAAAAPDLPDLLEIALEHTLRALGLEIGASWLPGQRIVRGLPPETGLTMGRTVQAAGLDFPTLCAVEDWQQIAADGPLSVLAPIMTRFGIRASITVPILTEERRIGGLSLAAPTPRSWSDEEIALAEAVGRQLGAAAERLRLFQAEREQRELAEALEAAAAAVSSTLDLDQVLDRILDQVERVVAGGAFNVMLIEDANARVVRWRGYEHLGVEEQIASSTISIAEYPNLVKMVQTGRPVVIPDTATDPNWVSLEGQEWRRSYIAAPVQVKDLTVGFLNVVGTRPGQFGPADARRLEAFADHAATAIENAGLYRELRNHAEELEQRVQERTVQLQAQYARLDAVLRSTSDGIVVADASGEIVQSNPVARSWLAQTLSPDDAARLQEAVCDLARRAEERPETVLELTGLDLELGAAPISPPSPPRLHGGREDGEPAAVVVVHDVSHLKALDRIKSLFVTNVSHELRTPVTTIKLYAALLQRTLPEEEKWGGYLDALTQEADRQARLVEDILQISRIDTGRLEMEPRPTPLNELAEMAVVNHQVLAQERGLTLEHRPSPPEAGGAGGGGPVALVDPERMMQVLNNLVRNAIQYTPEGGRVVIATGKEEAEGRVWATATVADTGMGIPEEELPHVFERFFRGEEPRLMQISGTGLGLAIVKEIVELHGGWVTVESPSTMLVLSEAEGLRAGEEGVGTTFTVWLPLADQVS